MREKMKGNQFAKGNSPNKTSFKKGMIPWNKGKHSIHSGSFKKGHKGFVSAETYKRMGEKRRGTKLSEETRKKIGLKNSINMKNLWKRNGDEMKNNLKLFNKEQTPWNKGMLGFLAGEKHYNWQGGLSFEPYDKTFNLKFKRAIRKRDNQVCMLCGIHRERYWKAFDVHHIDYDKLLSVPQNCISLCSSCHTKTNFNREHWTKFFQNLLSERYGYQYSENEIIMELKQYG